MIQISEYFPLVQIIAPLNIQISFQISAMIIIVDLWTEFIGMFVVCLHFNFHAYKCDGSLLLSDWELNT
jgi:hypothetical protein